MLLNATVQHRVKHFDLLLARELILLERKYEQNLLTHTKLEKSIRRDSNELSTPNRKKLSIPFNEIYHEHNDTYADQKMRMSRDKYSIEKSRSSITSSIISQNQPDEEKPKVLLKYRRYCSKGQRLPPIVKASKSTRQKRSSNDTHWMTNFPQSNTREESVNESSSILTNELSKASLRELTPIQKQVQSFIESLPTYKGIQQGFDSFGPSSLYSTRAPVAMR